MKRAGMRIEQVAELDNLLLAFHKAQRGKSEEPEVFAFRADLHGELGRLRAQLLRAEPRVGDYRTFTVHDPKQRTICAAPFRERVLHHALTNVCEPAFESYQIHDSYACRKDKGVYKALERAQRFARGAGFYLKLDVRKYFASIDHDVLKTMLRRRFSDGRLVAVLDRIVDGYESAPGRGVPIGNLTSQYFANHYLGALDHFAKETLGCRRYVRYMDDFVLWDDRRRQLTAWRDAIRDFTRETLRLELKPDCLNATTLGMTFLGYRVYPDRITLAARSRTRFCRKLRAAHRRLRSGKWSQTEAALHVEPLLAFVRHAKTDNLRRKALERIEGSVERPRTA